MTEEQKRSANRNAFPETARIVDEFRRVFGQDIRLVWAEESGRTIGKRLDTANDAARAS